MNYFALFRPFIVMAIMLLTMYEPKRRPGKKHRHD